MPHRVLNFERLTQAMLLAALAMPLLVFANTLVFPFVTGKVWFFETMVLAATVFAVPAWLGGSRRPAFSWVLGAMALFLLVSVFSAFWGVDTAHSLWANHERMIGLVVMALYVWFFFLLTCFFSTRKEWGLFAHVFLGVGITVLVLGFIQYGNPSFLFGGARVASTLGNPLYYGLFAAHIGFLGLYLAADRFLRVREWTDLRFLGYLGAVVLALIAVFLSQTRGVFVGLVAAALWAAAWGGIFAARRTVRFAAIGVLLAALLGALALFFSPSLLPRLGGGALGRLADVSFESTTNANRLFAWQVAVDAWRDRPLLGWGPFNYVYAFNEKFSGRQMIHNRGFGETWFDNAHNYFLEMLSTQGAAGFAAYLLLYGIPIGMLGVLWWKKRVPFAVFIILSSLLIMHGVQNVFSFEQPASLLVFVIALAFVHALGAPVRGGTAPRAVRPRVVYGSVAVSAILAFVMWYPLVLVPWISNHRALLGVREFNDNRPAEYLQFMRLAIETKSPYKDHLREELARGMSKINFVGGLDGASLELMRYAIVQIDHARNAHPRNTGYHQWFAQLLVRLETLTPGRIVEARKEIDKAFEQAVALSPHRLQTISFWGDNVAALGDADGARALFLRGRSFAPNSGYFYLLYAQFLERIKAPEDEIRRARFRGVLLDPTAFSQVTTEAVMREALSRPVETRERFLGRSFGSAAAHFTRGYASCTDPQAVTACTFVLPGEGPLAPTSEFLATLVSFYREQGATAEAEYYKDARVRLYGTDA